VNIFLHDINFEGCKSNKIFKNTKKNDVLGHFLAKKGIFRFGFRQEQIH